jgi:hypothetical protein
MQEKFVRRQPPPRAALIGETAAGWVECAKFKVAIRNSIITYGLANDFDTKIRGLHGNLHYAALGFLLFLFLPGPAIALSAHLRYLPMSMMFACVTFSSTSGRLAVGGVSFTRALRSEAQIGAVGGSLLSRLSFFFTPPRSLSL